MNDRFPLSMTRMAWPLFTTLAAVACSGPSNGADGLDTVDQNVVNGEIDTADPYGTLRPALSLMPPACLSSTLISSSRIFREEDTRSSRTRSRS